MLLVPRRAFIAYIGGHRQPREFLAVIEDGERPGSGWDQFGI
jgi:hypothetical protein